MVWILICEDTANGEDGIEVWDTRKGAQASACCYIQMHIESWDMSNHCDQDTAIDINNSIAAGAYREAIKLYHDYLDGNEGVYYNIEEQLIATDIPDVPIFDKDFFGIEEDEEGDSDGSDAEVLTPSVYVATTPGASCRQCGTTNEYAYADCSAGTYVCQSCKIFKGIFV